MFVVEGVKVETNPASSEISVGSYTGPQLKFPTNAPVEVCTLGTTPVRSTSFTDTLGLVTVKIMPFLNPLSNYKLNIIRLYSIILLFIKNKFSKPNLQYHLGHMGFVSNLVLCFLFHLYTDFRHL